MSENNEFIGIDELAQRLGVPVRTIYSWRVQGKGPRSATFGKHVRYRRADVDEWIEQQFDHPRSA